MKKTIIILIYLLVSVPFLIIIVTLLLVSSGALGFMPGFEDLENPKNNVASQVLSSDGEVLGTYFVENRTYATFEELSPNLVSALIATEDYRFERHSGIDGMAMLRVLAGVVTGSSRGGGSTITQQLAKNLFPRDTTSYGGLRRYTHLYVAKFKEWVTAAKLERSYTKKEILVMYLNTVPFSGNAYGIRAAARTFFDKTPLELDVEEAAVLVGVLKAPSYYNPVRNPERSLGRRNVVMSQMVKYGHLPREEYDSLQALPLGLNYMAQDHNAGLATYFREMLRVYLNASEPDRDDYRDAARYKRDAALWQNDPLYGWCSKNLKPDGTRYDLYRDGLRVHTTIDSRMQRYAEEAVAKHMAALQAEFAREKKGSPTAPYSNELTPEEVDRIRELSIKRSERYRVLRNAGNSMEAIMADFETPTPMRVFSHRGEIDTVMTPLDSIRYYKHFLHCGFMAVEPQTGEIRAYVGGINYKHFKYDAVKSGRRQVGSTFKPFLYTLAMQEGYTPCYKVPNVPVTFAVSDTETWTPASSGYSKYDRQMVTLKWGLANSINNISAWLMQQFKPQAVINMVRLMGVESPIPAVPSICLGSADLTLHEMVGAYTTFANKGIHITPLPVLRITDRDGNELSSFVAAKNEAISENAAYLMIDLLKGVVTQGTSIRLRARYDLLNEIAGKTGTTNNHSDGWFMGVVPKLVCGTWVGGEERSIHFDNMSVGQGANMALPVFAEFLTRVYADPRLDVRPGDTFERPASITYSLDCDAIEAVEGDPSGDHEDEFFD